MPWIHIQNGNCFCEDTVEIVVKVADVIYEWQ